MNDHSPSAGGCWICREKREDSEVAFDAEFDTFYHVDCLKESDAGSILEYERGEHE